MPLGLAKGKLRSMDPTVLGRSMIVSESSAFQIVRTRTRSIREMPPTQIAPAALTGACLGAALGIWLTDGRVGPILFAAAVAVMLWPVVRTIRTDDRALLARALTLAFVLRLLVIAGLHAWSVATGRHGFITGDDQGYWTLSHYFTLWLKGTPEEPYVPPYWWGEAYLFGTWVYIESAIFYFFGSDVLLPITLNAGLLILAAVLVFHLGSIVFGRPAARVASLGVAFFPSLVLWSSLNLKDALAIALITATLYVLARLQLAPRWRVLAAAFVLLVAMESLRGYIFVGLLVVLPVSIWLAATRTSRDRSIIGWTSTIVSALFLYANAQAGVSLGPGILAALEGSRQAMAVGARTSFQDRTVPAAIGDTFVVPVPSISPESDPGAIPLTPSPKVVTVEVGTVVVLATPTARSTPTSYSSLTPSSKSASTAAPERVAGAPLSAASQTPSPTLVPLVRAVPVAAATASNAPGVVVVQAGDVVVFGPPGTTPAPPEQRRQLDTDAPRGTVSFAPPPPGSTDALAIRTLSYLPRGAAYALFAPFPWMIDRGLDLLPVPEMLMWYALLGAGGWTLWRERARWRSLAPLVLFAVGTLLILALAEGNVGTLYRHRAMVVPAVIVLASPSLASAHRRWIRWPRS